MLTGDRKLKVFEYIKRKTSATTEELAKVFGVSTSTIRRDLEYLSSKKLIKRIHNGAMINSPHAESGFLFNYHRMHQEKKIIAKKAVKLIDDYDFIALSGGTTCYILTLEILESALEGLTILTNSINIATLILESMKDFRLVMAGGIPRKGTYECVGEITLNVIRQFNVDKFFLGVNGISFEGGVSFSNVQEAEVARELLNRSTEVYIVADHTKFGVTKPARLMELSQVKYIVTDSLPDEFKTELSSFGNLRVL